MKFIDQTEIYVRSGAGGPGMVSFLRARNKPKLGPDGGDGGFGGDVVIECKAQMNTLAHLRNHTKFLAENGVKGGANNRTGRNGEDCVVCVPRGTQIFDASSNQFLGELLNDQDRIVVAKGGKRGIGNSRFVSSTHQAPHESTSGGPSEEFNLRLELKLLADVGIAGAPNIGKSTFLSVVSSAKPKIADYPFTTLEPQLGVVAHPDEGLEKTLVFADIPGLIEGASEGKGLGHFFLKHLERTRLILMSISLMDFSTVDEVVRQYEILDLELKNYSEELYKKPKILMLTKKDLLDADVEPELLVESLSKTLNVSVFLVSSIRNEGIPNLLREVFRMTDEISRDFNSDRNSVENSLPPDLTFNVKNVVKSKVNKIHPDLQRYFHDSTFF